MNIPRISYSIQYENLFSNNMNQHSLPSRDYEVFNIESMHKGVIGPGSWLPGNAGEIDGPGGISAIYINGPPVRPPEVTDINGPPVRPPEVTDINGPPVRPPEVTDINGPPVRQPEETDNKEPTVGTYEVTDNNEPPLVK
ncbi:MAG: hypothetical protein K8R67_07995 [Desulfobacteraceae bacterium]|nr:hypothetical protein [Desulfobacteraceae bacterium]